jgi:hypothetical protein
LACLYNDFASLIAGHRSNIKPLQESMVESLSAIRRF